MAERVKKVPLLAAVWRKVGGEAFWRWELLEQTVGFREFKRGRWHCFCSLCEKPFTTRQAPAGMVVMDRGPGRFAIPVVEMEGQWHTRCPKCFAKE